MPPRKRVNDDAVIAMDEPQDLTYFTGDTPRPFLREGMIVNVVTGGRTLTGYEVLGMDANFIKFRGNMQVAPQTEIVLIPFARLEAIGITDER